MTLTFEKYSEKSYVVRGPELDSSSLKKQLISELTGRSMWNNKLKGGAGLVVLINDHNKLVLEKYSQSQVKNEEPVEPQKEEPVQQDEEPIEEKRVEVKEKIEEKVDKEKELQVMNKPSETTRTSEIRTSETKLKTEPKKRYISDSSDSDSDDYKRRPSPKKENEKRRYYSSSSSSSDDYRSRKRSSSKSRGSSKSSKRRSYSSESDLTDSSVDERIRQTIRKKNNKKNNPKVEITDNNVDSDREDVISLSRRLRYVLRQLRK